MPGRDQGKGKTKELWGREAVIQKATRWEEGAQAEL